MFTYVARLVRVVDGDTVDLDIDLGFHLTTRQRVRLADVNTPERGKPGASEAGLYVIDWFADREQRCMVATRKGDSFGRWLGYLSGFGETSTLNELLVQAGLAQPYRVGQSL